MKGFLKLKLILPLVTVVMLASGMIIALSGNFTRALAQATPPSSSSAPASYSCVAAPHAKAPPTLHNVASISTLKPICSAGQVPQSYDQRGTKGHPPTLRPTQPNIAAGYHYVSGYQYTSGIGADAYFSQHKPFLSSSDYHTLAEIAAESGDGKQIVEIGWTVDRGLNGDANPHLFVFSWVNGVPNCYNGCGYVQYSSSAFPGMTVPSNSSQALFAIEYYNGNWWLYYNQWIGYFPGSIWSNKGVTFTQVGLIQWFGEVSSGGGVKTQMGNGIFGSRSGAASIKSAAVITSSSSAVLASVTPLVTDSRCYNFGWITQKYSFRYGGPGC